MAQPELKLFNPDLAISQAHESKRERFVRIVEPRATLVAKALKNLASLGENADNYEYDEDDVEVIRAALQPEFDRAIESLRQRRAAPIVAFKKRA